MAEKKGLSYTFCSGSFVKELTIGVEKKQGQQTDAIVPEVRPPTLGERLSKLVNDLIIRM
jgi:hypothetical protein